MKTFLKYEKIFRILIPSINIKGKRYLSDTEVKLLLGRPVQIFEKMDGGNTGIYVDKNKNIYLQKRRGHIDGSHKQYTFFKTWALEKANNLQKIPANKVVFGELMRCKHSIYYDKLPDWFLMFDVYDLNKKKYLPWNKVVELCEHTGLHHVPLLYEGKVARNELHKFIPKESVFGDLAEGIVVKNYKRQLYGKVVKEEFIKMIDKFWRNKPIVYNRLK